MAVSKEQKLQYNDKVKVYKAQSEDLKKEIATVKGAGRRNAKLDPYFQVRAAILGIQRANTLVQMSKLSLLIQSLKNDSFLNDARKELASRMTDLLKVVGDDLDGSLTDNQDRLVQVSELTPEQKLNLMQGFKQAIENVRIAMGEGAKWRWNFPDMYMNLVRLGRNLLDFKRYERTKDPMDPNYQPLQEYMRFLMDESQNCAQEFRSKYELSTKNVSELQQIDKIFAMQKQVYTFTGQKDDLQRISIALDSNKEKIEALMAEKKSGKKKKG